MAKKNSKKIGTFGYLSLKESLHGHMLYNRHDMYVGRSFEMYGQFSNDEFEILRPWATGGMVLDIGANIGALTIPLARIAKSVLAIEPQPWVADVLTANVAINNLRNVDILRACVGEKSGSVSMPISDPNIKGNFGGVGLYGVPSNTTSDRTQHIQVYALDDLTLGKVDVIKMDVEGHEEMALRGMSRLITESRPIMYVEADRTEKLPGLFKYIRSFGYEMTWHKPMLFERNNYFDESENVFPNLASHNVLCYFPDKHVEIDKAFKYKFRMEPCF